jgi:hypothetical protein
MNKIALMLGISASYAIIFFTLAFIVLISIFPPGEFSTVDQFISDYSPARIYPVIPGFLLVLANIPFFISMFYVAEKTRRPLALTGILMGAGYAVCSGINYFIQLTVVPLNIHMGQGLSAAQFMMLVPGSFAYALDTLGYTFLSLSFLFFSGIFNLKGFQGYIKAVFVVYGISGILGTLGYIAGNSLLESFVFISAFPYLIAVVMTLILYIRERKKQAVH